MNIFTVTEVSSTTKLIYYIIMLYLCVTAQIKSIIYKEKKVLGTSYL